MEKLDIDHCNLVDNSIQYALVGDVLHGILMPGLCVYIIEGLRAQPTHIAQIAFSVEFLQEMLLLLCTLLIL